jgi:two-component system sensor histidine kinase DesK
MAGNMAATTDPPVRRQPSRLLWLIYLVFFLMGPIAYAGPREIAIACGGVAIFLPIYLVAPRFVGWRALWPMAAFVGLAVVFVRQNPGASVFFVYAAAESARLGAARRTRIALAGLMALVGVVGWGLQASAFFWLPALTLIWVVGTASLHQVELERADREVRRSREEVEQLARIAERERIARDLHDLLGHTLSVVVLKSELAARLAERDPKRAAEEIREVEKVARQALAEVRAAVTAYRAETIAGELENARRALAAAGVEMAIELDTVTLPPLQEGVLALALREAVTNVVRHAHASHCRVTLRGDGDRVRLLIEDDGRGVRGVEGSGLTGMRERVAGLGGMVERLAGAGTRLAVHLPLPALKSMSTSG